VGKFSDQAAGGGTGSVERGGCWIDAQEANGMDPMQAAQGSAEVA